MKIYYFSSISSKVNYFVIQSKQYPLRTLDCFVQNWTINTTLSFYWGNQVVLASLHYVLLLLVEIPFCAQKLSFFPFKKCIYLWLISSTGMWVPYGRDFVFCTPSLTHSVPETVWYIEGIKYFSTHVEFVL